MGILDEAIRDHLELKRRGGTQEQDLMRLEDEAFGPPTRPGDPAAGSEATSEAPHALKTADEASAAERASTAESAAAPESAPAQEGAPAANGTDGMGGPAPERGDVFHDFAAEEGLVPPSAGATAVEEFKVEEAPAEPATGSDAAPERAPESPAPPEEAETSEQAPATPAPPPSPDDTQPHDMEAELGPVEAQPQGEPAAADEVDDDLELRVEEDEIEIVEEELEVVEEEGTDESPEELSADDVLEETPDFLEDTPEHDRLWFEQKPPKDFDFDE
jgi:hypothetical protein